MKIKIFNKTDFDRKMEEMGITDENVEDCNNLAIISITGTKILDIFEREVFGNWFQKNHWNVLNLSFDDITSSEVVNEDENQKLLGMNESQAREIIDFIDGVLENVESKENLEILIHCQAGISRSGAVGAVLNDYLEFESYSDFYNRNSQISPNPRVSRLLNSEIRRRLKK